MPGLSVWKILPRLLGPLFNPTILHDRRWMLPRHLISVPGPDDCKVGSDRLWFGDGLVKEGSVNASPTALNVYLGMFPF